MDTPLGRHGGIRAVFEAYEFAHKSNATDDFCYKSFRTFSHSKIRDSHSLHILSNTTPA